MQSTTQRQRPMVARIGPIQTMDNWNGIMPMVPWNSLVLVIVDTFEFFTCFFLALYLST